MKGKRIDSKQFLCPQDWDFIDLLDQRLGYIQSGFESALKIPSVERYEWAQDRVYDVKRNRYLKRGIPYHDTESVGDHTLDAIGLATLHTPDHCLSDTIERMILIHSLPQAIIGNLKSEEGINEQDKKRAERLAACVILQDTPRAFELWEEYEAGQTHEARVARDIQHAQTLIKIAEYQRNYPKTRPHFKPYWEKLETAWVSDAGRSLHHFLVNDLMGHAANDDKNNPDNNSCLA